ncbi:orotidine-5'-phosphate decarboxylase [Candidatus Peregrinibacteria bacterium]|nr:orotidine-5'-phosphate decarboxylase [Candidatus Peregrinibacteria bacterium]
MQHFADRLIQQIKSKKSSVCVGLDPRLSHIPKFIQESALACHKDPFKAASKALVDFNKGIIDAVYDLVPVVKLQIAFYEIFGPHGMEAFLQTIAYAKEKGLIVIADAKRSDIDSTAKAYAQAFLGEFEVFGEKLKMYDVDAMTVNPYLGYDSIKPFIEVCKCYGKGIFVLVKTSNFSSADIQDLYNQTGQTNYEIVARLLESWGADEIGECGYSCVGAVVGATFPKDALRLRSIMPNTIFLVPGYGAQGATVQDVKVCFHEDGLGAIVNSSRNIIFAYQDSSRFSEKDYALASRQAVIEMNSFFRGSTFRS